MLKAVGIHDLQNRRAMLGERSPGTRTSDRVRETQDLDALKRSTRVRRERLRRRAGGFLDGHDASFCQEPAMARLQPFFARPNNG